MEKTDNQYFFDPPDSKGISGTDHSQAKTHYKVLISADEYYHAYTHQILNESFHGSLTNFISAFTGNQNHQRF